MSNYYVVPYQKGKKFQTTRNFVVTVINVGFLSAGGFRSTRKGQTTQMQPKIHPKQKGKVSMRQEATQASVKDNHWKQQKVRKVDI